MFDPTLKCNEHVDYKCSKLSRNLYLLKSLPQVFSTEVTNILPTTPSSIQSAAMAMEY